MLKGLTLDASVSETKVKQLQGFGKTDRVIPVILIGQLGKNDRFRSEISGQYILEQIFKVVSRIQYFAGGRLALVECRNVQKLRAYYEANDFSLLQIQNGYLQMIRRI